MLVRFNDPNLERCVTDQALATERWGVTVAERYAFVINFLTCVDGVGDIDQFTFLDATPQATSAGTTLMIDLGGEWRLAVEASDGAQALTVTEVSRDNA